MKRAPKITGLAKMFVTEFKVGLRTALTLVGPTRDSLVPDPLAVLHLDNQLYIIGFF